MTVNLNWLIKQVFLNLIKSLIFGQIDKPFGISQEKKGEEIIKKWRPDVIYASAWPITSLIIAKKLSEKLKWQVC